MKISEEKMLSPQLQHMIESSENEYLTSQQSNLPTAANPPPLLPMAQIPPQSNTHLRQNTHSMSRQQTLNISISSNSGNYKQGVIQN